LGILCLFKAFTIIATAYYTFVISGHTNNKEQ